MIQKIILLGTMGKDFEVKTTKDGKHWGTGSLAVNYKSGTERKTAWFKIKAFNKTAELLGDMAKKGRQLYVEGRPEVEAWIPTGSMEAKATMACLIDEFYMVGPRENAQASVATDDLGDWV